MLIPCAAVVADFVSGSTTELGDVSRLLDQNSDNAVARDRDALTARQVHERRSRPVDAILHEWCAATAEILPMLRGAIPFPDGIGPVGGVVAVNDIVVHEGDLHEALGLEPPAVGLATSLTLGGFAFSLDYRIRRRALPALALEYDGKRRVVGEGDPAAVVSADRTTLVRLMASRLTVAQVLELAWRGVVIRRPISTSSRNTVPRGPPSSSPRRAARKAWVRPQPGSGLAGTPCGRAADMGISCEPAHAASRATSRGWACTGFPATQRITARICGWRG